MPSLSSTSLSPLVKMMMVGHSGAGKTGALTSLVGKGYRVRILDLDQGLDALRYHVKKEFPSKLDQIDFMSFRDDYVVTNQGSQVKGLPKAFVLACKAMDKWEDGTDPGEWGPQTVFVLDSLTNLGRAALDWAKGMNPGARDPRQWYSVAQNAVENVIAALTSETFSTNVIVMTHIDIHTTTDDKGNVTAEQGYASAIGKALGPKIPRYFNTMVSMESIGTGKGVKKRMRTLPTAILGNLKNPAPGDIEAEYPIETGLASLFDKLRG
jgi:hypothetical protein